MDLKIENNLFIVCGAGSGFGRSICELLANENAKVIAVSRTKSKLYELEQSYPNNIQIVVGDIFEENTQNQTLDLIGSKQLSGVVVNAGGPPAGGFDDVSMEMWQKAWESIVKWKISFVKKILPLFLKNSYGKLLFIESVSVKEPVANLILSNSLRAAVVGFAKTLSQEVADKGVTVNVLAPGYHSTAAIERLFEKKALVDDITISEAKSLMESDIPVGKMGHPDEMASLALWLLSPKSRFVTGQTITHDGGMVKYVFG